MSPEDLEERIKEWFEGFETLKHSRKYKWEAGFFIGSINGLIMTLEALGYDDWEEVMLQTLGQPTDEVKELLDAGERWLGRKVFRSGF